MAVLISPETPYGKELWKWEHFDDETHPVDSTIRGMRPRAVQPYPEMMCRVTQKNPLKFDMEVVRNLDEKRASEQRGFSAGGPEAATEAFDRQQQEYARIAAARAYEDRNMSERAKAEAQAADDAASGHLPAVPETPVRRGPGRPSNADLAARDRA